MHQNEVLERKMEQRNSECEDLAEDFTQTALKLTTAMVMLNGQGGLRSISFVPFRR